MHIVSRIALAGLALTLAVAATVQYAHHDLERARAHQLLLDTGLHVRLPEVAKKAEREPDPKWAKIFISRALLAEHIDQRWLLDVPPQQRQQEILRMRERLQLARALAAKTYSFRPAIWQAAMILGGVTMLDAARSGVEGLVAQRSAWERALRTAIELAPGQDEPYRLLAGGYLGIWPHLTSDQNQEVRSLLARAFDDDATFLLFADTWLSVANDRNDAFSLVPDRSSAWRAVMDNYRGKADWAGYIEALARWDEALLRELSRHLVEAETRLRSGDLRGARSLMLSVAQRARLDTRYMEIISRALNRCPPGPPVTQISKDLSRLLDWALERLVLGKPSLQPAALKRLAGALAEPSVEQEALVALATDGPSGAEVYERQVEGLNTESWAPYLLLKARKLAENDDLEAARTALAMVHRSWRGTAVESDIRRLIAGGAMPSAAVGVGVSRPAKSEWRAADWKWHGRIARLYLVPASRAQGVQMLFERMPLVESPLEISWDHESQTVALVSPHDTLQLRLGVTPELHVLEVESLAARRAVPSLVRLVNVDPRE